MAENNFREYLQRDYVRVKKYFYVLRPILACDWIQQTDSVPPVEFQKLLETQVTDGTIKTEIDNLLARKMAGEELNEEPQIKLLNDYLDEKIRFYNQLVKTSKRIEPPKTKLLDELFKETLQEVWQ